MDSRVKDAWLDLTEALSDLDDELEANIDEPGVRELKAAIDKIFDASMHSGLHDLAEELDDGFDPEGVLDRLKSWGYA